MRFFERNKDLKIKKLEAEIEELKLFRDAYNSVRDNYLNKIVRFMGPEDLMFYLKKRAELNVALDKTIGPYTNQFPKAIDESTIHLMEEINRLRLRYEADLEASAVFIERESP